ncbi:thermonuclease family protein [Bordetella hinzii]|nr:thermonuclease family protein [Bordetella hinzii]
MIRAMLAGCLFALAAAAHAGELRGRVVAVADGDTLTILDASRQQHRIRLAEIDAPEKGQPFGQRSKQSLSGLCFGREAVIEDRGHDRYGRTIGRVSCAGIDANAEQVRRGMAWVFDRYATDRSLYAIQDEARAARRGLWSDAAPVPPWEWRAQHRREAPPKSQ